MIGAVVEVGAETVFVLVVATGFAVVTIAIVIGVPLLRIGDAGAVVPAFFIADSCGQELPEPTPENRPAITASGTYTSNAPGLLDIKILEVTIRIRRPSRWVE